MEDKILEECANWIAEQASDQLGGFIPAELLDLGGNQVGHAC